MLLWWLSSFVTATPAKCQRPSFILLFSHSFLFFIYFFNLSFFQLFACCSRGFCGVLARVHAQFVRSWKIPDKMLLFRTEGIKTCCIPCIKMQRNYTLHFCFCLFCSFEISKDLRCLEGSWKYFQNSVNGFLIGIQWYKNTQKNYPQFFYSLCRDRRVQKFALVIFSTTGKFSIFSISWSATCWSTSLTIRSIILTIFSTSACYSDRDWSSLHYSSINGIFNHFYKSIFILIEIQRINYWPQKTWSNFMALNPHSSLISFSFKKTLRACLIYKIIPWSMKMILKNQRIKKDKIERFVKEIEIVLRARFRPPECEEE